MCGAEQYREKIEDTHEHWITGVVWSCYFLFSSFLYSSECPTGSANIPVGKTEQREDGESKNLLAVKGTKVPPW